MSGTGGDWAMRQPPVKQSGGHPVYGQAARLMRQLNELDRAASAQEWWMLARAVPEARSLAEVSSLLAVASAELDQFLVRFFGDPATRSPAAEGAGAPATAPLTDEPDQVAVQRASAARLSQTLESVLPPTTTFAHALAQLAQRTSMTPDAVDALGIVAERLDEAQEALRAPAEG